MGCRSGSACRAPGGRSFPSCLLGTPPPPAWAWCGRWECCLFPTAITHIAQAGTSLQTRPWRSLPCLSDMSTAGESTSEGQAGNLTGKPETQRREKNKPHQNGLLSVIDPALRGEVGRLGAVKSMIESGVVGVRESYHELPGFLSNL